jgi:hypothetical protein
VQAKRSLTIMATCLAMAGVAGCGGGNSGGPTETPKKKSMSDRESEVSDAELAEVMADGEQHDEEFHKRVLDRGARKAQECGAMGAPTGEEGEVTVLFDGKKGRVTEIELGYPFADASDQAQKCITNSFVGEMIPPFEGELKTSHTFTIPDKSEKK